MVDPPSLRRQESVAVKIMVFDTKRIEPSVKLIFAREYVRFRPLEKRLVLVKVLSIVV